MRYLPIKFHSLFFNYLLLNILFFSSSCIDEDHSGCVTGMPIYIQAFDAKGNNITASGDAGDVQLYVFDEQKIFIEQFSVSSENIKKGLPVNLNYKNHNNIWVVAWSNLKGNQKITTLVQGMQLGEAYIQLIKDASGFALSPDDLFFGIANVANNNNLKLRATQTLPVERKTALMTITVKGLDPQYSNYHFVIKGANNDTYDFNGQLKGGPVEYNKTGKFDLTRQFFETDLFSLYPIKDGDRVLIYVYRGDQLIVIADKSDKEGKNIVPTEGLTNNIIIYLDQNNPSSASVNIEVTDWKKKYQWVEW